MTVQSLKLLGNKLRRRVSNQKLIQKKNFLYAAFLLALGIILYGTYASYRSLEAYSSEHADVQNSYQVLERTEELVSLMKDSENGHKGYVLTQDESFLDIFYTSKELVPKRLEELERMAAANLDQQAHLQQIRDLIDQIHSEHEHVVNLSKYQNPAEAIEQIKARKGKSLMDSLRREIKRFETQNRSLLWEKKTEVANTEGRARINNLFGNLFSIVLLGITFVFMRNRLQKEENLSRKLELEVQKRTEELHSANEELLAGNEELNSYLENIHATQQELEEQQKKLKEAYASLEQEDARKTAELEEARELQIALLPDDPPAFPHLDLKLYLSSAAEVGGDYYDYQIDERGDITFAIGDVTGHGLKAGILVATAKSYFQNLSNQAGPVIMQAISKGIKNLKLRAMYMGLAIIKQSGNLFKISSAGMPPMMVYRKASGKVEKIRLTGIFLGFHEQQQFREVSIKLETGDILLAMSDGLIEAFNVHKESLGIDRLAEKLQQTAPLPSEDIVHKLIGLGESWTGEKTFRDDLSIIAIKVK